MGWLGRGSFRGIGFCVKWIFGNWKMRVDARWLTATNPIFLCIYNFGGLKAMSHRPANYQWTMVCQSVRESSQKYKQIRLFFEHFCCSFFFAAGAGCRGWLHAHRGSGTTVQVCWCESQSLGCFGIVVMANWANEGPCVNWKFVGLPWFVLSLFNSPWMKQVGEMRNQILVKFYSELLWNAMHITSVWHSILASGSMKFFEGDYPRIWAICATKKTQSENEKAALRTFIQSEELFIHFRHFLNSFTLPIPTRIGIEQQVFFC